MSNWKNGFVASGYVGQINTHKHTDRSTNRLTYCRTNFLPHSYVEVKPIDHNFTVRKNTDEYSHIQHLMFVGKHERHRTLCYYLQCGGFVLILILSAACWWDNVAQVHINKSTGVSSYLNPICCYLVGSCQFVYVIFIACRGIYFFLTFRSCCVVWKN